MRLGYNAGYGVGPGAAGVDNSAWVAWIKQALEEYKQIQPYIYADFFPLLPYSLMDDAWTGWQWSRPEQQDGIAILLRHPKSNTGSIPIGLHHIDADAYYEVHIRYTFEDGAGQM